MKLTPGLTIPTYFAWKCSVLREPQQHWLKEINSASDVDIQFVLSALTESDFPTLDLKISKALLGDSGVALGYRIELATVDFKLSKATYKTFLTSNAGCRTKKPRKWKRTKVWFLDTRSRT